MLRDIEETFHTMKKINMKPNPSKWSFGMEEGKFLGVIVTSAGFKANPDKVQAIVQMNSPSSLKEVQTLNRILVALNRFLANHASKSFPFVSTLLNFLKKAHFKWIVEAEQAFMEVKKCLMELPTLSAP
ncbi:putative mitochondrial protein AtMg00860 [Bidens hawaiensis]|uniref:putative mitochondrial protein AtMg00860 n=1 Tax=Bidens hawaiensis TaxID=980011 RepID=UPI004049C2EA